MLGYSLLLFRHKSLTGKYTTRKIHMKLHPGLVWYICDILTSEDIDAFTDVKFVSWGTFLWDDLDQDQLSKITRIMVHQRN